MPRQYTNMFYTRTSLDAEYSDYTMMWKTSKGDIVRMCLSRENWRSKVYYVSLSIGKRKVGYKENEQTGRSGIEGLCAALVMMNELINNMYEDETLIVQGSDNRRHKIYKHYLEPLGFRESINPKTHEKSLIYKKNKK